MKNVIGRKQNWKLEDEARIWDVYEHADEYVSDEELAEAENTAVRRIEEQKKFGAAGFCWSGGKDSLVLADLCEKAGVTKSQLILTGVEYPAWETWMVENMPSGCEVVRTWQDLDWLSRHEEFVFPHGAIMQKWHKIVQQDGFVDFVKKRGVKVCFVGHRTIDGNMCYNGVCDKGSWRRVAPIYDWSHEMLFAYMKKHGIELPFIYKWNRGFRNGGHQWPIRKVATVEDGYSEIWEIDKSVVINAAEKLKSARIWLNGHA